MFLPACRFPDMVFDGIDDDKKLTDSCDLSAAALRNVQQILLNPWFGIEANSVIVEQRSSLHFSLPR